MQLFNETLMLLASSPGCMLPNCSIPCSHHELARVPFLYMRMKTSQLLDRGAPRAMEEALLFYSFLYRQLCSNKTLMCEQAGGFNFPCHSFLMVSAMLRLLNDTIWGKHLKGGPQKRTVIIVSVFSADSPPDSLNTRVLSPWCC